MGKRIIFKWISQEEYNSRNKNFCSYPPGRCLTSEVGRFVHLKRDFWKILVVYLDTVYLGTPKTSKKIFFLLSQPGANELQTAKFILRWKQKLHKYLKSCLPVLYATFMAESEEKFFSLLYFLKDVHVPTQVVQLVAGLVEGPGVELEADDGEDDDGEQEQERDVDQRSNRLANRTHHNLKTWKKKNFFILLLLRKQVLNFFLFVLWKRSAPIERTTDRGFSFSHRDLEWPPRSQIEAAKAGWRRRRRTRTTLKSDQKPFSCVLFRPGGGGGGGGPRRAS